LLLQCLLQPTHRTLPAPFSLHGNEIAYTRARQQFKLQRPSISRPFKGCRSLETVVYIVTVCRRSSQCTRVKCTKPLLNTRYDIGVQKRFLGGGANIQDESPLGRYIV